MDHFQCFTNSTLNQPPFQTIWQCESVWPSSKALLRLVSGRTSVRYRFGSPFSSKRLWFVDTVLWLCPSLPTETLKWLSSLPTLMQESFWWWQCSNRYISLPLPPPPPIPLPFSPSLISLTVFVDVKHHVYLLTIWQRLLQSLCLAQRRSTAAGSSCDWLISR